MVNPNRNCVCNMITNKLFIYCHYNFIFKLESMCSANINRMWWWMANHNRNNIHKMIKKKLFVYRWPTTVLFSNYCGRSNSRSAVYWWITTEITFMKWLQRNCLLVAYWRFILKLEIMWSNTNRHHFSYKGYILLNRPIMEDNQYTYMFKMWEWS